MSDKTDIIYDTLKEMKEDHRRHEQSTSEFREKTVEYMGKFESRLDNLDDKMGNLEADMARHIEGVSTNRESIKVLQQPMSVKKLAAIITGTGAVFAAFLAIIKFLDLL